MKARIAAVAIISLLTLSAIALGYSALGDTQDVTAASTATTATTTTEDDNTAVSAFKFVCPFH